MTVQNLPLGPLGLSAQLPRHDLDGTLDALQQPEDHSRLRMAGAVVLPGPTGQQLPDQSPKRSVFLGTMVCIFHAHQNIRNAVTSEDGGMCRPRQVFFFRLAHVSPMRPSPIIVKRSTFWRDWKTSGQTAFGTPS